MDCGLFTCQIWGKWLIKYYSHSTLKMEAVFSTETVVSIHQIEWRSNPEENSHCERREIAQLQKCLIWSWREKRKFVHSNNVTRWSTSIQPETNADVPSKNWTLAASVWQDWRWPVACLNFWHWSFTFNSNKSLTWCKNFSVYYPDVCLQLNMFRAFPAHHQELSDCSGSLWFYLRIVVIVVLCSW
jgi:hypothetical protein